jgi:hypothetical protein
MRFAVESWDPAYGSATESLDLETSDVQVDAAIERPADQWEPIRPARESDALPLEPIWFVDGVRRIDARVWIAYEGASKPGVCASVAAGALRVADQKAEVARVAVERGVYTTQEGAGPILTSADTYQLRATTDTTPEATYLGIHAHMTELERLVTSAAGVHDTVVVDGPLRGRSGENTIGYVKTQHVQYLQPEHQEVLARLEPGDRTPLFLLGGRQSRYSWYLRLPGPRTHALACIVRCEIPAIGDVTRTAERAEAITGALHRFASEPHKDARAPHNLYPIAGLEHRLRHLLGDARVLERALRSASLDAA